MSSAIYPDPPRLVTAVCGHGEQQRLSNARLRLTFYNAPVAYCGPARPGSAFQQSAVSGLLPRARARVGVSVGGGGSAFQQTAVSGLLPRARVGRTARREPKGADHLQVRQSNGDLDGPAKSVVAARHCYMSRALRFRAPRRSVGI